VTIPAFEASERCKPGPPPQPKPGFGGFSERTGAL